MILQEEFTQPSVMMRIKRDKANIRRNQAQNKQKQPGIQARVLLDGVCLNDEFVVSDALAVCLSLASVLFSSLKLLLAFHVLLL
jgi:hypothetical protein